MSALRRGKGGKVDLSQGGPVLPLEQAVIPLAAAQHGQRRGGGTQQAHLPGGCFLTQHACQRFQGGGSSGILYFVGKADRAISSS